MAGSENSNRARVVFAAILIAGLAAAGIMIPLLAGGEEDAMLQPADPECIEAWNSDRLAVQLGQHQSLAHSYANVQVLQLADDGSAVPEGEGGNCAVVFAAQRLDPEPGAAAQIERNGRWGPLSDLRGVSPRRLGELQSDAVAGANAHLDAQGQITAIEAGQA